MDYVAVLRHTCQRSRIQMLADLRRERAEHDHLETMILHAIATDPQPYPGDPLANGKDYVREEVAAVLHLAPVTAGARLDVATRLVTRFAATLELMQAGKLPGYYATKLVELTDELSDTHAAKVEERVLPRASEQTLSQFTAAVRRAVLTVDPRTAEEKHGAARDGRRVVFNPPSDDSMVDLWARLPAERAAELESRIDAHARSWRGLDDRTLDQRRADALCALGADLAPVTAHVNVTVALSTLLGADDHPADLDNNPVTAAIARAIAYHPGARWRRLLHDNGRRLIDVSSDTYEPPEPLRRFIQLRDRTCQFPGCQRPAVRCEEDHTIPWRLSHDTSAKNLVALCLRHHHLKHETAWSYTRNDHTGTITWISPHGHVYKRPPPEPPPY